MTDKQINKLTTNKATTLELNRLLTGESEQITQLLQKSYTSTSAPSMNTQTLVACIRTITLNANQTLLDAINEQADTNNTPNPLDLAIILFTEQFFNEYIQLGQLHSDIKSTLTHLRKNIVISMLTQHQWPWQSDMSLSKILQLIHQHCIGWHPAQGRASTRFLTILTNMITDLTNAVDDTDLIKANTAFTSFFSTETQRLSKLEKRLLDAEKGALYTKHAQKICAATLNQLMAGKKLPKTISQFLQGPIRKSMQLILINDEEDSPAWKHCVSLSKTLIWSFQPIGDDELRSQQVYQSISQITDKLQDAVVSLQHDNTQLDSQLSLIEAEHLKVLKGEALDYEPFELIYNADPLSSSQAVISSSLLTQINLLSEGQWFCFQEKESPFIKLTLKLDKAKQLLFTNFLGVKSENYSFEEFAYKFSSKAITLVDQKEHYKLAGESLVTTLFNNYQDRKQHHENIYAEKQRKLKLKLQAQETARAAALEQARKLAKSEQENRLKAEREAKEAEVERRKISNLKNQQDKSIFDIERLTIGGLVEFYNDIGEYQQLKLTVKLQSSGKYLFVDRTGIKREEKLKDELAQMLKDGSAKIVNEGTYFEDSLVKVVNSLRKERNI